MKFMMKSILNSKFMLSATGMAMDVSSDGIWSMLKQSAIPSS